MQVKQLIKELKTFNPDTEIIMASDAEGNNFFPVCEVALTQGKDPNNEDDDAPLIDHLVIWPHDEYLDI